ncbi:ATP-dependent RNA helicase [Sphingomonas sp. ID1715]|uniref:RcnB family protein n=1 Tax=Sphingomonas sp. ID1715 TaxID=1656898 RepID=UPI001489DC2C|nr:RcnB family protein [Sphingomonas sp. ID1715]NNM76773.1 ATP-dependent RNA helicase [Sphingomonas sp. ID1715]
MRKIMVALLAAASLTAPAAAQRQRFEDGGVRAAPERTEQPQQQRQLAREGMRQAFGGGDRQERREARQEFRQERQGDRQGFRQERREDRQQFRQERQEDRQQFQRGEVSREQFRRDRAQDVRDYRRDRAGDIREFRRDRAEDRRDFRRDNWNGRRDWQRDRARDGRFGYDGNRWGWNGNDRGGNWSRDWRRDPRYNWQDWRQRNRGSYRFPRYYAPRGWDYGYRRFSLGVILSAPLFSQNYWISDPWEYRLPPAYGPYRWVRYYDDVLLVDVRDGRVVDVIYDFFW